MMQGNNKNANKIIVASFMLFPAKEEIIEESILKLNCYLTIILELISYGPYNKLFDSFMENI